MCDLLVMFYWEFGLCVCMSVCVRAHAQQLGICSYAWHFGFEIRQEIVMQKSVFCLFVFSFLHLGCS